MSSDRTKGAPAETSAHNRNRVFNDLISGYSGPLIRRMRFSGKRQTINPIQFLFRKRQSRRIDNNSFIAVFLNKRLGGIRIQVFPNCFGHFREKFFIFCSLFVTGKMNDCIRFFGKILTFPQSVNGSPNVPDLFNRLTGIQSPEDLCQRRFSHSVRKKSRFGIHHNRPPNLVAPVIIMSRSSQTRFNSSGNNRNTGPGFPGTLTIGQCRPIRAVPYFTIRRISVIISNLAVGRIMIDH